MAVNKSVNQPDKQNHPVAFLIVDGSQVVVIDKPVTTIGRKSDNHIVINNEHVSRHHVQIRKQRGKFFILDLNSTVGTSVNGKKVEQTALKPGDIISLGGVPLIFGEGTPLTDFDSTKDVPVELLDSAPTENSDIQSVDEYLDLFESTEDDT
jgi:pSer/pThr/pTyr-binding forkhead associated (FHA) protein